MGFVVDTLDEDARGLMEKHLLGVIEANRTTNLTRIDTFEEGWVLHVEDSLCGLEEVNAAPEGLYGDLGSGAGFPGIPLAIATGRPTLLVDARKKKMDVVKGIINDLGLSSQVSVFAGRAELLARTRSKEFSVITARALAKISVLLELSSPLLKKGGRLVCYKSHIDEDEMSNAERVQGMVGMSLVSDRSFDLDGYQRRILVFEKTGNPRIRLPRMEGQAQKNPL